MLRNIDIIHGDIKPDNVLIFRDDSSKYIAKVTDFGYSTNFTGNGRINMPASPHWNPPESDDGCGFTFTEAQKMDAYSFGMLCLWFLFGGRHSEIKDIPPHVFEAKRDSVISFQRLPKDDEQHNILPDLKSKDKLPGLAQWLIMTSETSETSAGFNDEQKSDLSQFFRLTLIRDWSERSYDFGRLLRLLAPDR